MNRNELLTAARKLEPALCSKDLVAILSCICFAKGHAFAYDGFVALHLPFEGCPIRGAVKGNLLLEFLSKTKTEDLVLVQEKDTILIKAGRSKLETAVMPESEFQFELPTERALTTITVSEEFVEALQRASISMGADPVHPSRMGITVVSSGGKTQFYSTDNRTATRIRAKIDVGGDIEVLLPPRFINLFLSLARADETKEITMTDKWVVVEFASGMKLFSRVGTMPDVGEYKKLFENYTVDGGLEIPQPLARCLERAVGVLSFTRDKYSHFRVKEGNLFINTDSDQGTVKDKMPFAHDDIEIDLAPNLLLRALEHCTHIRLQTGMVMVKGNRFDHIVGTVEMTGD